MKHRNIRQFESTMSLVGRGLKQLFWDDDSPLDLLESSEKEGPREKPKVTITVEGVSLPHKQHSDGRR